MKNQEMGMLSHHRSQLQLVVDLLQMKEKELLLINIYNRVVYSTHGAWSSMECMERRALRGARSSPFSSMLLHVIHALHAMRAVKPYKLLYYKYPKIFKLITSQMGSCPASATQIEILQVLPLLQCWIPA
ncbi:unnamed protein product [Amoebophrya sp. A25]|nr:unnamed protein product [Amoebophrya sp. A25]|eukprot:GSA25T00013460001.1